MKTILSKPIFVLSLALSIILCNACIVPLNSSFESARTLKKGEVELMGNYSKYTFASDGESEVANNNIGLRIGYGISDKFDLKFRYERLTSAEYREGYNYLAIAPKIGFLSNKIAFTVPVGAYFQSIGKDSGSDFFMSPKFLFTYPANNKFEVTFATKADIFFEKNSDLLLGFNFGLGFSDDLDRWALRPEIGMMIDPGEKGKIWTFGIGLNFNIKSKKSS
jgi:hypothetical protein